MANEQTNEQPKKKNWFAQHKVLTGIIVLVVLGIIGASSQTQPQKVENSNTNQGTTQNNATPKVDDKVYKVGESVKLGNAILTVNKVETSNGGQFSKPQEGNEWLNLNITVENTSSTEQFLTTMGQMFIKDGEGNSYQVAVTDKTVESVNNDLDGTIIAKSKRTGWVGFEVKKAVTGLKFQYNGSIWGGGNIIVDLGR